MQQQHMQNSSDPSRLLPQNDDKIIRKPPLHHHLCRHTNPEYELKDSEGKLNAIALEEKRIIGYSTNKIPRSIIEDIYIEFYHPKKIIKKWKQGNPPAKINDEDFFINNRRGYFLILIKDIHEYVGHYPKPADEKEPKYKFTVKVFHKPLNINYCHFELEVYDDNNQPIKDKIRGWRKIIVSEIRNRLIEKAQFEI